MKLFKNMRIRHAQMMVRTDLRIPVVCEKWDRRSDSLQERTKLPSKQLSLYSRAQRVFRLRPVVLQNERVTPAGLSCMRIAFRVSGRQVVYASRVYCMENVRNQLKGPDSHQNHGCRGAKTKEKLS